MACSPLGRLTQEDFDMPTTNPTKDYQPGIFFPVTVGAIVTDLLLPFIGDVGCDGGNPVQDREEGLARKSEGTETISCDDFHDLSDSMSFPGFDYYTSNTLKYRFMRIRFSRGRNEGGF